MKATRRITLAIIAALLLGIPTLAHAQDTAFYVLFEGAKQGVFKGTANQIYDEPLSEGTFFSQEISRSLGDKVGTYTSTREYSPVRIRLKSIDALTQLYQAVATNEMLPYVGIIFIGTDVDGTVREMRRIVLENAAIVSVSYVAGSTDAAVTTSKYFGANVPQYIDVELTFGTLAVDNLENKTSFVGNAFQRQ